MRSFDSRDIAAMNLAVPYSWLKEYVRISASPKEIASRMSLAGCTIDRIRVEEGETIFDVEITTNRPDAFSMHGFAREVAAVFKKDFSEFVSSERVAKSFTQLCPKTQGPYSLSIQVKDSRACRRYCGVALDHIVVRQSPAWMQQRLRLSGLRPINSVVDITNYVMLEFGQPLHAFDADALASSTKKKEYRLLVKEIVVRLAKKGETITTLDGEEKKLLPSMLVIADGEGPLAIAGIKGGGRAGITQTTNTIVLESASFDPISIRKTSRELDLRTDSSARYEKGFSPEYSSRALLAAVELLQKYAGAVVASPVIDHYPKTEHARVIAYDTREIERIIGISIPLPEVKRILVSLGFLVSAKGKRLIVKPPFWRRGDCEETHDLVEEVARIYGYSHVSGRLLSDEIPPLRKNIRTGWERKTKEILRNRSWIEVMNYSCISESLLEKMAWDADIAIKIHNPLSRDFMYLRPQLLGGVLETIASNEQRASELRVFELSKVYSYTSPHTLPSESMRLTGALTKKGERTSLFRMIKGAVEVLCAEWFSNTSGAISFRALDKDDNFWQKGGTAVLYYGDREVGMCGFVREERLRAFGIKTPVVCFDIAFDELLPLFRDTSVFRPLPKFPSMVRDMAFITSHAILYQEIERAIKEFDTLISSVELFDVFESSRIGHGKRSLALHITYLSSQRTLLADEVDSVHGRLIEFLTKKFGVQTR